MSLLTSLPAVVLREVADKLSGIGLIHLWLSGDRHLLRKLSSGGVTSAEFLTLGDELSTSRLPRMIENLTSLTSLALSAPNRRLDHPFSIWKCLSQLRHLRCLILNFPEADLWMFEDLESFDMGWLGNETFIDSGHLKCYDTAPSRLRPLSDVFPRLEELHIYSATSALTDQDLAQLPLTLTALHLPLNRRFTWNCLSYLQEHNVTMLEIAIPHSLRPAGQMLPASVTHFDSFSHRIQPSELALFCSKSKHLRYLPIDMHAEWNPECIAIFPSTMERFELSYCSANAPVSRLRNLKEMTVISPSEWTTNVNLSPHLESLTAQSYSLFEVKASGSLLSLRNLCLSFRESPEGGEKWLRELLSAAPHLRSLALRIPFSDNTIFTSLPSTLVSFEFGLPSEAGLREPVILDSPSVKSLPRTLTRLVIPHRVSLPSSTFKDLPKRLRELTVPEVSYSDLRDLKDLPPELTKLKVLRFLLSYPTFNYDEWKASYSSALAPKTIAPDGDAPRYAWDTDIIEMLPKHLEVLNLSCTCSAEMINALPRGLKHLHLSGTVPSRAFSMLPQGLKCLKYNDGVYDSADLAHLPPGLRVLSLYCRPFNPEHLALLPKNLRSCTIQTHRLTTIECLKFVPPNVQTFETENSIVRDTAIKRSKDVSTQPLRVPDDRVRSLSAK